MATLVSGINVSNGTIVTPAILNAAPTLTPGTVDPSDLTAGSPSWDGSGNLTATSFVGNGAALTGIVTLPTGVVLPFAYSFSSAPAGWLICDGTLYSTTTYAALYALLGTLYGSGSGTFAVPDLRGYFIRGKGTNSDGTMAGTFGVKQADAFQGHDHPNGAGGNYSTAAGGDFGLATHNGVASGAPMVLGTNGTPRIAAETRPANIAMLYCIKT